MRGIRVKNAIYRPISCQIVLWTWILVVAAWCWKSLVKEPRLSLFITTVKVIYNSRWRKIRRLSPSLADFTPLIIRNNFSTCEKCWKRPYLRRLSVTRPVRCPRHGTYPVRKVDKIEQIIALKCWNRPYLRRLCLTLTFRCAPALKSATRKLDLFFWKKKGRVSGCAF